MNLRDPDYSKQMVAHFETLQKEGKIVEYTTLAERVYTARGIEKGRKEGREEGKLEVAKTMLAKGFTVDQVAEFTGLSRSEIETVL